MRKTLILLLFILMCGCAGWFATNEIENTHEHDLRMGNVHGKMHPEWSSSDRCTQCHMIWSWEYGYYRPWDRHGFISDYNRTSPFAYCDPFDPDTPDNIRTEFYYTDWWKTPWFDRPVTEPAVRFDQFERVNDGTARPEDFAGAIIVVSQDGSGDAASIQEGVDKAKFGETVFVNPGIYRERVVLKEGIRLWGKDVYTTIIDPDYTGHAITAANNCDISGFTLKGTGMNYKTYEFNAGVYALDCDSTLVIRGNFFDSNAVFGVLVESTRAGGTPQKQYDRYIPMETSLDNIRYTGFPNPRIIGNTFYMIGERAIYSIHAAPEICNNIFIGNVKTVGMTQHACPFVHHNVFYRNNVTFNTNRSKPIIAYNIMVRNYWGQRIIEGSKPYVHNNITWNSVWYREFDEAGAYIPYKPIPGVGDIELNPGFADPDNGDFRITSDSLLKRSKGTNMTYGLIRADGMQPPPVVKCERSYAEEFLSRTPEVQRIVAAIESENSRIGMIEASYTIDYKNYLDIEYNEYGDQESVSVCRTPVSGVHYEVPQWVSGEMGRQKTYMSRRFRGTETVTDSGTVLYDGEKLTVLNGDATTYVSHIEDPDNIGEHPTRETIGGLYFDYDQYLNGAIGPGDTFYYGYLKILGGIVKDETAVVDGHTCVVAVYPHLGADQLYTFYLDPDIGYRPRKLEQTFEGALYRTIDGYEYREINGKAFPVKACITDYVVKGPHRGEVAGFLNMTVNTISEK